MAYTKLVFSNQMFVVSGSDPEQLVSGSSLITAFSLPQDLQPWRELGIVLAFVVAIRVLHFVLLWMRVYPYVKHQLDWSAFFATGRTRSWLLRASDK